MLLTDALSPPPASTGSRLADAPPAFLRPDQTYALYYKRKLDIWLTIVLIVLAAPFLIPMCFAITFLIALDGSNPIYMQRRVGRHGRVFRMYKFRTMVPNADGKLASYLASNPDARTEWRLYQKLRKDPRITLIGGFLRKTSLDELPQLINVLRGEMSLVGPRPMVVEQRKLYPGRGYFLTRPGLTGAWQVSDRNDASFAARAAYDDTYLKTLSLKNDLVILLRTIVVVFKGTGV